MGAAVLLPKGGLALDNSLNDGVSQGLHPLVAGVIGNSLVREGSFRARCVGGVPAE
jgi:hypothetical protein